MGRRNSCLPFAFDASMTGCVAFWHCTQCGCWRHGCRLPFAEYGTLTLLQGRLPRAVCITSTATELLMNSDFHLLLAVLNCFCTSGSLMSLQKVMREEQACFCERRQCCSLVEKTLSRGLCSWLLFVINLDGNVTSDFSHCIV